MKIPMEVTYLKRALILVVVFVAIPLIPLAKETIDFLRPRVRFEGWTTAFSSATGVAPLTDASVPPDVDPGQGDQDDDRL